MKGGFIVSPYSRQPRPPCKNCGKPVPRPMYQYCSLICQRELDYRLYIERWMAGQETGNTPFGVLSRNVRRYLLETRGEQCEQCGWNIRHQITGRVPLDVHHIDGNHANSTESNLILLCPNCHALTPTYRALNAGYGRMKRRKRSM